MSIMKNLSFPHFSLRHAFAALLLTTMSLHAVSPADGFAAQQPTEHEQSVGRVDQMFVDAVAKKLPSHLREIAPHVAFVMHMAGVTSLEEVSDEELTALAQQVQRAPELAEAFASPSHYEELYGVEIDEDDVEDIKTLYREPGGLLKALTAGYILYRGVFKAHFGSEKAQGSVWAIDHLIRASAFVTSLFHQSNKYLPAREYIMSRAALRGGMKEEDTQQVAVLIHEGLNDSANIWYKPDFYVYHLGLMGTAAATLAPVVAYHHLASGVSHLGLPAVSLRDYDLYKNAWKLILGTAAFVGAKKLEGKAKDLVGEEQVREIDHKSLGLTSSSMLGAFAAKMAAAYGPLVAKGIANHVPFLTAIVPNVSRDELICGKDKLPMGNAEFVGKSFAGSALFVMGGRAVIEGLTGLVHNGARISNAVGTVATKAAGVLVNAGVTEKNLATRVGTAIDAAKCAYFMKRPEVLANLLMIAHSLAEQDPKLFTADQVATLRSAIRGLQFYGQRRHAALRSPQSGIAGVMAKQEMAEAEARLECVADDLVHVGVLSVIADKVFEHVVLPKHSLVRRLLEYAGGGLALIAGRGLGVAL